MKRKKKARGSSPARNRGPRPNDKGRKKKRAGGGSPRPPGTRKKSSRPKKKGIVRRVVEAALPFVPPVLNWVYDKITKKQ